MGAENLHGLEGCMSVAGGRWHRLWGLIGYGVLIGFVAGWVPARSPALSPRSLLSTPFSGPV